MNRNVPRKRFLPLNLVTLSRLLCVAIRHGAVTLNIASCEFVESVIIENNYYYNNSPQNKLTTNQT